MQIVWNESIGSVEGQVRVWRHHNDLFVHFPFLCRSAALSWTSLNFTFSSPKLRLFLIWLDCICPLWKPTMLRTNFAYGSHGPGLLPSPDEKYLSILTTGKPNSNEKSLMIPQYSAPWIPYLKVTFQDHVQPTYRNSTTTWPDLIIWHRCHAVPATDAGRDKSLCSPCLPTQTPLFYIHPLCVTFTLQVLRPILPLQRTISYTQVSKRRATCVISQPKSVEKEAQVLLQPSEVILGGPEWPCCLCFDERALPASSSNC